MARSDKRNRNAGLRKAASIELSDKNRMLRIILLIVFMVIAIVAFTIGLKAMLETEEGWAIVESSSNEVNCSADFVFSYCYGAGDLSASQEKKQLSNLYSQAVTDAYRIFNTEVEQINASANRELTVDPALYQALSLLQQYGNRSVYLGPVYREYFRVFNSPTEVEAADLDPRQDAEQAAYIRQLAAFANDPDMVELQLLGDNRVILTVAEPYLSFAAEYEITDYLDFNWMRNAFIADYLAETVSAAGFTCGYLSSFDGFTRNLDSRGESFSLNLFDRLDNSIYLAGVMHYTQPISIVFLRNYPMSQKDIYGYYAFSDGRVVTAMADPADGLYKSATDNLVSYAYGMSCAEVLLRQCPVYIADTLDEAALQQLQQQGVYSIWFENEKLYCNDPQLQITLNRESEVVYTRVPMN